MGKEFWDLGDEGLKFRDMGYQSPCVIPQEGRQYFTLELITLN